MQRIIRAALVAVLTACAPAAFAQSAAATFPSKPIRIVVPFSPGSTTDIMARTIGERLSAAWGQPVVVENVPGAGGTIGIGQVAKSAPDGYTLTVVSAGHVVNPVLYSKLPYELKDLAGVSPLGTLPSVIIASPESGIKSMKQLVDQLKARPGQLNYATAGSGSAADVHLAKFRAAVGYDAVHIPLKGTPQILIEVSSGRVQFSAVPLVSSIGQVKEGKVVPLSVSTPARAPALPDVPTAVESGFPSAEFNFWVGMLAPAGTPKAVLDKLNTEITRTMATPEMRERLAKLGADPMPMTPEKFDAFILDEARVLGAAMKAVGAKAE
jgi:tripartite-type tricarboxylate transporter receptor subunit TctC